MDLSRIWIKTLSLFSNKKDDSFQSSFSDKPINYLRKYCSEDPVIRKLERRIKYILSDMDLPIEDSQFEVLFVDFSIVPTAITEEYFTELMSTWPNRKLVVINARALLELEAVIRSFNEYQAFYKCRYLENDEELFTLTKVISSETEKVLKRQRQGEFLDPFHPKQEEVPEELTMITLFFLCHELGHIISEQGAEQKDFGTFFSGKEEKEFAYQKAITKLCRHTEEFEFFGFGLPGFSKAADEESEVRAQELLLREEIERIYDNCEVFFNKENQADEIGAEIIVKYLDTVAKADMEKAENFQFALVKGLFASSLFLWTKDLMQFLGPQGLNVAGSPTALKLSFQLLTAKDNYVKTAKLFGNHHRFTLLRVVLGLNKVLKRDPVSFSNKWEKRHPKNEDEMKEWRAYESCQRYKLLCMIMDTAVKFAYVGCSFPYMKEIDQKRKSQQLLLIKFDSLEESMRRIKKLTCNF